MYIPVDNIWCESAPTKVWPWPDLCTKHGFYCSRHATSSHLLNVRLAMVRVNLGKPMRNVNFDFSSANLIWDARVRVSAIVVIWSLSYHLRWSDNHPSEQPSKSSSQTVPQLSPLASSLTSMLSPLFSWTGSFFSSRLRQPHFQASHWKQSRAAQGGAISSGSNSSSGKSVINSKCVWIESQRGPILGPRWYKANATEMFKSVIHIQIVLCTSLRRLALGNVQNLIPQCCSPTRSIFYHKGQFSP